jgi:hypothetical protein
MKTVMTQIHGKLVPVDVELRLDGASVTLKAQDARRLADCIHWSLRPPVNGKVSLIVEAETIQSSVVWKAVSSKHDTTDQTKT